MSPRAAWQLERLGFTEVHDFVVGKAHWLATGRPTERPEPAARIGDHLTTDVATVGVDRTVADARTALDRHGGDRVVVTNDGDIVIAVIRAGALNAVTAVTPVSDVMTVGPTTIRPDENPYEVAERMRRHDVAASIVTTPTGAFLGLFLANTDLD
jgi:CBS domain-containing protein